MKFTTKATTLGLCLGLAFACSKKDSNSSAAEPEEGSSIVISGALKLSGETALRLTADTAVDDLSIYCVTFTIPPVAGTGDIAADGSFSLTLEAYNVSVGCFINKADEVIGTIVFKDPSKTNISGGAKSSDRLAFGGDVNLGEFVLDLTTGKAEVDISKISVTLKSTAVAAADSHDFTGTYKITSSGLTMPTGYTATCSQAEKEAAENSKDGEGCHGPTEGEELFFKRIDGKAVSDGSDMYGAMIWASEASFKTCGSKLGVSFAEAKEHAGIDLTNSGVAEGAPTWTAGYEDGWKNTVSARANQSLMNMENVDNFNGYPGSKQFFKQYRTCAPGQPCDFNNLPVTVAEGFSFYANTPESGCRNAAGKPVMLNDWSNMTCEHSALAGGLNKQSCTKEFEGSKVTCVHIGGTFLSNGTALENAFTQYPDDYTIIVQGAFCDKDGDNAFDAGEDAMWSQNGPTCSSGVKKDGALCKDIPLTTEAGKLAQLRCYADAFYQNRDSEDDPNLCLRDIRTNWGAKTAAEFMVGGNGPARARSQFVFELFEYASPTTGSLRGENIDYRGIQVGENFTDCEIRDSFSFSIRKYDDSNDLLVEMIQSETNVSNKPACIAEFGAGESSKFLFKMIKQ